MGFIVILAVGAILGWLATIITRTDDGRSILLHVGAGMAGALLGGALASNGSLLLGVSVFGLLGAVVGSIVLVAGLSLTQARIAR